MGASKNRRCRSWAGREPDPGDRAVVDHELLDGNATGTTIQSDPRAPDTEGRVVETAIARIPHGARTVTRRAVPERETFVGRRGPGTDTGLRPRPRTARPTAGVRDRTSLPASWRERAVAHGAQGADRDATARLVAQLVPAARDDAVSRCVEPIDDGGANAVSNPLPSQPRPPRRQTASPRPICRQPRRILRLRLRHPPRPRATGPPHHTGEPTMTPTSGRAADLSTSRRARAPRRRARRNRRATAPRG